MTKFFKMVQNEFVKIFAQLSTKIYILILLIIVLGANAFALLATSGSSSYEAMFGTPEAEQVQQEIDALTKGQYAQERIEAERMKITLDAGLSNNYRKHDDWRYGVINRAIDLKGATITSETAFEADPVTGFIKVSDELQKQVDNMAKFVKDNDGKGYAEYMIKVTQADSDMLDSDKAVEKWKYETALKHNIYSEGEEWKYLLLNETVSAKSLYEQLKAQQESGQAVEQKTFDLAEEKYLIGLYRIENDVKNVYAGSLQAMMQGSSTPSEFWVMMSVSVSMISIVSLLIIIFAGSMISSEFSSGTIKFLLVNPVKRGKILMSKYFCLIVMVYLFIALFYVLNIVTAGIFFGFDSMGGMALSVKNAVVVATPGLLKLGVDYLVAGVSTLVMGTFAFAMSALFRNAAFSIGIGVFALLGGTTLINILQYLKVDWARYILFANLDLTNIANGSSIFSNHTLTFALLNIAVYMVVFLWTAWDAFIRRDIK